MDASCKPCSRSCSRGAIRALSLYAGGQTYLTILGEGLSEKVLQSTETSDVEALGFCTGEELAGAKPRYHHPFIERTGPIVVADYVTMEDGTGLVHTAPGHGEEDYRTGLREGLEIYCPVKGDGSYDETVPAWLQGQDVWSANQKVVDHLAESKHLFLSYEFDHSYPHDWRSKTPTIFRATEQWFISVDREVKGEGKSLRDMALRAAEETINFVPDWGQSRLAGMLESRPDWCISRQRTWGLQSQLSSSMEKSLYLRLHRFVQSQNEFAKKVPDIGLKLISPTFLPTMISPRTQMLRSG